MLGHVYFVDVEVNLDYSVPGVLRVFEVDEEAGEWKPHKRYPLLIQLDLILHKSIHVQNNVPRVAWYCKGNVQALGNGEVHGTNVCCNAYKT